MEFMSIDQIIKHLPSDSRDVWKGGMSFHSGILGSFGILCRTCNLMACGLGGGEVFIWGVYIISLKAINLRKVGVLGIPWEAPNLKEDHCWFSVAMIPGNCIQPLCCGCSCVMNRKKSWQHEVFSSALSFFQRLHYQGRPQWHTQAESEAGDSDGSSPLRIYLERWRQTSFFRTR